MRKQKASVRRTTQHVRDYKKRRHHHDHEHCQQAARTQEPQEQQTASPSRRGSPDAVTTKAHEPQANAKVKGKGKARAKKVIRFADVPANGTPASRTRP